jgi:tetratricopeptide (TPR) repeat protein
VNGDRRCLARLAAVGLVALTLTSCGAESQPPAQGTLRGTEHFERERWLALEETFAVPIDKDGTPDIFAASAKGSESGTYEISRDRGLLVTIPLTSALRVVGVSPDTRGDLHERIVAEEIFGPRADRERPGRGLARALRRPQSVALHEISYEGRPAARTDLVLRLRGRDSGPAVVRLLVRDFEPVDLRFAHLTRELAGRSSAMTQSVGPSPRQSLEQALAAALPWAARDHELSGALAQAADAFRQMLWQGSVLEARMRDAASGSVSRASPTTWRELDFTSDALAAVQAGLESDEVYRELPGGGALELEVAGPAIVQVLSRVPYREPILDSARRYRIRVLESGLLHSQLYVASGVDPAEGLLRDETGRVVSRRRTSYFAVGAGAHRIRLESDDTVLIRGAIIQPKIHWLDALTGATDSRTYEQAARESIEAAPNDTVAARYLAAALTSHGSAPLDTTRAEALAERWLALAQDEEAAPLERVGARIEQARLLARLQRFAEAREALVKATDEVAGLPARLAATPRAAIFAERILEVRAEGFLLEGRPERALPVLVRRARDQPGDPARWRAAGATALHVSGNEVPEPVAVACLERALALDPAHAGAEALYRTAKLRFGYYQRLRPTVASSAASHEVVLPDALPLELEDDDDDLAATEAEQRLGLLGDRRFVALPTDGKPLSVLAPRATLARLYVASGEASASSEPIAVEDLELVTLIVDGRKVARGPVPPSGFNLRVPMPAGIHEVSIVSSRERLSGAALLSGNVAPADPHLPRKRRLVLDALPALASPEAAAASGTREPPPGALIYPIASRGQPGWLRITAHAPKPLERPATLALLLDGEERQIVLSPGLATPLPDAPGVLFRLSLPLDREPEEIQAFLLWNEPGLAPSLGLELGRLRRGREELPAALRPQSPEALAAGAASGEATEPSLARDHAVTDPVTSVRALSQALRADTDDREQTNRRIELGHALLRAAEPSLAADQFLTALRQPDVLATERRAAGIGLAHAYAANGEGADARAILRRLAFDAPSDHRLREELADMALRTGARLTAATHYRELLDLDPGNVRYRLGLGESLARAFLLTDARDVLEPLIEVASVDPIAPLRTPTTDEETRSRARTLLGLVDLHDRRPAQAARHFERALALGVPAASLPFSPAAGLELAQTWARHEVSLAEAVPLEARVEAFLRLAETDVTWTSRSTREEFIDLPARAFSATSNETRSQAQVVELFSQRQDLTSRYVEVSGPGIRFTSTGPAILRLRVRALLGERPVESSDREPIALVVTEPGAPAPRSLRVPSSPSSSVVHATTGSAVGLAGTFEITIPPGTRTFTLTGRGAPLALQAATLQPGFFDPLSAGALVLGPIAASVAAAEALALLEPIQEGLDAARESRRMLLRARAKLLLGQTLSPSELGAVGSLAREVPTGIEPASAARALLLAGDPAGCVATLGPTLGTSDDSVVAWATLAEAVEHLSAVDAESVSNVADLVDRLDVSNRHRARVIHVALARTWIDLAELRAAPSERWYARALSTLLPLAAERQSDPLLRDIVRRARRGTEWRRLRGLGASDGFRQFEELPAPVSNRTRVIDALLTGTTTSTLSALVTPSRSAAFDLTLTEPTGLLLEIEAASLLAQYAQRDNPAPSRSEGARRPPIRFEVRQGDKTLQAQVAPGGGPTRVWLKGFGGAAGPSSLNVDMLTEDAGTVARVSLFANRPIGSAEPTAPAAPGAARDGDLYPVSPWRRVEARVAETNEPGRLQVRGPAVLRIEARALTAPGRADASGLPLRLVCDPPSAWGADSSYELPMVASDRARLARPRPGEGLGEKRVIELGLTRGVVYTVLLAPAEPGASVLYRALARVDRPNLNVSPKDPSSENTEEDADTPSQTGGARPPEHEVDTAEAAVVAALFDGPDAAHHAAPSEPAAGPKGSGTGVPGFERGPGPGATDAGDTALTRDPRLTRLSWRDAPPSAGQEDGTFEVYVGGSVHDQGSREVDARSLQDYAVLGSSYRKRLDDTSVWLRGGLELRAPEQGREVYHAFGHLVWATPWGFRSLTRGDLYAQDTDGFEGTVTLDTRLDKSFRVAERELDLYAALGIRAREQTLDSLGTREVEDTYFHVFSPYYQDHDHVLYGRLTLTWRPFLDLEGFLGGGFDTNRNFAPWDLDRFLLRGGLRGTFGPVLWKLEASRLHRIDDDDRGRASEETRLDLSFDGLIAELGDSARLGFTADGRVVIETGETSLFAGVRILVSGGRIFRDHIADEAPFRRPRSAHDSFGW